MGKGALGNAGKVITKIIMGSMGKRNENCIRNITKANEEENTVKISYAFALPGITKQSSTPLLKY